MPDWQKMYAVLCGAISDGIDLISARESQKAAELLQEALNRAEDLYMEEERL